MQKEKKQTLPSRKRRPCLRLSRIAGLSAADRTKSQSTTLPDAAGAGCGDTSLSSKAVGPAYAVALRSAAGLTSCGVATDLSAMAPLFAPFLSRGKADRMRD
jgi:hypothetical protein